jgi:hypothetical protein
VSIATNQTLAMEGSLIFAVMNCMRKRRTEFRLDFGAATTTTLDVGPVKWPVTFCLPKAYNLVRPCLPPSFLRDDFEFFYTWVSFVEVTHLNAPSLTLRLRAVSIRRLASHCGWCMDCCQKGGDPLVADPERSGGSVV